MSCKPCAACRLLSRLRPFLACAEPSLTVHCSCHGSLALLATGSFGSYRASPAPNRLPTFIASDMPARAACHLHSLGSRRTLLVLSYLSSLIAGVVAASRCLSPAHLAHTAPNMLVPHLACAELPSNLYCSCHVSLTLFATCLFGSCRAAPAAVLSHLLSFIANGAMPAMHCLPLQLHMLRVSSQLHAACHLLLWLIQRIACAEPSSNLRR